MPKSKRVPKFTAVCPHCRVAKYRAPWTKLHTTTTCQKCGREFTLTLEDEPPLTPAVGAGVTDAPVPATPGPPPIELGGGTPLTMALVGLGVVGVAVLVSQVPYGRIVAAVLAPLGALVAGLSLLGLEKRQWLGWAGVGLNLVALLLVVALPDWLGGVTWTPAENPDAAPKPVTAVGRDGSLPRPADWVDAQAAAWEQGDVRVAVTSVAAGPLDAKDQANPRRVLRVALKLTNVGVAREVAFAGWAGARLTTAAGAALADRTPAGTGAATVRPGKSAEAVLVFDLDAGSDELRLELPPAAFGGTDAVKFRIPRAMVSGRKP